MYLATLIDKFKELHPTVRVSIREGPSSVLADELLDLKHDICLIGVCSPYSDRLRLYRIPRNEQLIFVASPEYPLPLDTPVSWTELISHPLIIEEEGSAGRAIALRHFEKRGLSPRIGAEVNNIELAKQLARQKKGVALMFEPNVRQEFDRGDLRIIHLQEGEIKMGAIDVLVNKEMRPSAAAEAFLRAIKEHFNGNVCEMPPDKDQNYQEI